MTLVIGVLALQGAFVEHLALLGRAAQSHTNWRFEFMQIRTVAELSRCDGLVIPGGESTTLSLVAERSGMLEPLREFVKVDRKPTWGTCAGLILLAEAADATKKGGQELIGGLDVRVHRNHFGRQIESFEADLDLPFLSRQDSGTAVAPFRAIFIRAPIVEAVLSPVEGEQADEARKDGIVVAPSKQPRDERAARQTRVAVEVLGMLPERLRRGRSETSAGSGAGDIVAVRQGNVFGTSFHPELTDDVRIHAWWLNHVIESKLEP